MPCSSICEVSPTRLIMVSLQDVINLILANASVYRHIRPPVKEISANPRESSTMMGNLFPFLCCQMLGKLPYCQIVCYICISWHLDSYVKQMLIWKLVIDCEWIIYLWDSRQEIND